jgi:hypothetical protein
VNRFSGRTTGKIRPSPRQWRRSTRGLTLEDYFWKALVSLSINSQGTSLPELVWKSLTAAERLLDARAWRHGMLDEIVLV